jgi:hypothetical protein
MKKLSTNTIILIVCVLLAAGFIAVSEPVDEVEHRYVLAFRNYLIVLIGFYYYALFKWPENIGTTPNENSITPSSPWSDFKFALFQAPPMILVLGYSLAHLIILSQVGMPVSYMVLDILLLGLQVIFFIYLIAVVNHLHATESSNLILMMVILLNILTVAATFSFYLLLNPFGGWVYAVHFIGDGNILLQYAAALALIVGMGMLLLGLKRSSERKLAANSLRA